MTIINIITIIIIIIITIIIIIIIIVITIYFLSGKFCKAMERNVFFQSYKRINHHDDIVLRTPTTSIGERMLDAYFKNQTFKNESIREFEFSDCEKEIQDIMRDIR